MKNLSDPEDDYDYSPNELARLSKDHYRQVVGSNIGYDNIDQWERDNMKRSQEYLAHQRSERAKRNSDY